MFLLLMLLFPWEPTYPVPFSHRPLPSSYVIRGTAQALLRKADPPGAGFDLKLVTDPRK